MPYDASLDDIAKDRLLLQRARDILAKGWCVCVLKDRDGNHCALGALNAAAYGHAEHPIPPRTAGWKHWNSLLRCPETGRGPGHAIADWNNAQTSAEPVLARFDEAIARLSVTA